MTQDNEGRLKKNPIRENLEEQFRQLGVDEKAPEDLKKEVFDTLDNLTLFGDVLDLFTAKFSTSEAELIDMLGNPAKNEETETGEEE